MSANFIVPPMSTTDLYELAINARKKTGQLVRPAFDFDRGLISDPDETLGIGITVEDDAEFDRRMPGAEAYTEAGMPQVHLRTSYYYFITDPSSYGTDRGGRARFTLAHEMLHALRHVIPPNAPFCRRVPAPPDLPAYYKSEWQADRFAGAFLIPPPYYRGIMNWSEEKIAMTFKTSLSAARIQMQQYREFYLKTTNPSELALLGF